MTRWHGIIGFSMTQEEPEGSGIWKSVITEREYSGLQESFKRSWDTSSHVNDDININCQLKVIADPFLYRNIGYARYAEYMGSKWKITMIENEYPHISITLGGVYNAN